jgi:hypothetical protein
VSDPHQLLTDAEFEAMEHLISFVNVMAERVVGNGPTRGADLNEIVDKVHQLQAGIMAQAAARAYPDEFRLLGGVVTAGVAS